MWVKVQPKRKITIKVPIFKPNIVKKKRQKVA
jgi:hypothetical protein